MDKKEKFVEKMVELLALGEKIVNEFYEKFEEEEIPADQFTTEVEIMCLHLETGLDILKKI